MKRLRMRAFHRSVVFLLGVALVASSALADPKGGKKGGTAPKGGTPTAPKGGGGSGSAAGGGEIEIDPNDAGGKGSGDGGEIDMGQEPGPGLLVDDSYLVGYAPFDLVALFG